MIGAGAGDCSNNMETMRWVQVVPHLGAVQTIISPECGTSLSQTRLSECQLRTTRCALCINIFAAPLQKLGEAGA